MSEDNRRKRVQNIKKWLIIGFVTLLLGSFLLNIVLLFKVWSLDKQIKTLYSDYPYNIEHTM